MNIYGIESEKHKLRNGKILTLRKHKMSDLKDFIKLINGLVDEDAMILMNKKITEAEEIKWLRNKIKFNNNGTEVSFVGEIDGHVIGAVDMSIGKLRRSHVGQIGISIANGYRDLGIGRIMLECIIKHAKQKQLKLLTLDVFSNNKRALHLYKSIGLKIAGEIPGALKYKKRYENEIIMFMNI